MSSTQNIIRMPVFNWKSTLSHESFKVLKYNDHFTTDLVTIQVNKNFLIIIFDNPSKFFKYEI